MFRVMCKSKIHRASITKKSLYYEGSIGIDKKLLDAANIYSNEFVQVVNLNNGNRFETYVIEEKEGGGEIVLYGPAARLGEVGDVIIIISSVLAETTEIQSLKPKFIYVNKKNEIIQK
jgi:aspartate 1-decarboxylase